MMRADRWRRVRRVIGALAASLFFLALAGATYQGVLNAIERHRFSRPGGMVDAGGHQLHIHCTGAGAPTVVLEAPGAGISAAWGWVQPQVTRMTRVCSYDRAGLGWSEQGEGSYAPEATAPELDRLLAHAGEKPPFVVVGQGFGAALATSFAARFGDRTAALVLVDPPSSRDDLAAAGIGALTPWLARVGILRVTGGVGHYAAGLPPSSEGPMRAFLNRPDHLTRAADELARWNDVIGAANAATLRPDLPVARIETAPKDRVTFLTRESAAAAVVSTILDAVARARAEPRR